MANALGVVINPPLLTPPRVSLLTSAEVITDESSRWMAGYSYSPEGCGNAFLETICPSVTVIKEQCANPGIVQFQPYVLYAADKCSAWSHQERDFYGRAERKLLAAQSYWIEHEFMLDTLGLGNSPVASPLATTITAGAVPPYVALAALEDSIGDCSQGGRMMIHVRPGILSILASDGHIRREGNLWLTASDNIVVVGRGYPGTGPNGQPITGSSEWIYATSMVQIRLGNLVYTPSKDTSRPMDIPQEAINRRTNDIVVVAERIVSTAYDPTCCVLAAETQRG